MWAKPVSTFFGVGLIPFMPGTFGSLFALALSLPFVIMKMEYPLMVPLCLLAFSLSAGFFAVSRVLKNTENKDPKWVVIDEAAGQSLALLIAPPALISYLMAFLLFRVFDILKPFPINRLEKLKGAWGVFADDLLAGAIAGVIVLTGSRFL